MRVSGLGVVPAKYDPARKTISYQVTQPLRGYSCTVIVEAKMGDKKAEAQWTFTSNETGERNRQTPPEREAVARVPKAARPSLT